MKGYLFLACSFFLSASAFAQNKKPLDHSVYDKWQSVVQPVLSNDGKWIVYNVNPQEGDGELVLQTTNGQYKKTVARGADAIITNDSRFAVFRIKPYFKETREARIKKKKPDEMPKDVLAVVELGKDSVWKSGRIKSFKTPEKGGSLVAYLSEKMQQAPAKPVPQPDTVMTISKVMSIADSLMHIADSLKAKVKEARKQGRAVVEVPKKVVKPSGAAPAGEQVEEGTELVLRNLTTGEEKKFQLVSDYYFSKNGKTLIIETTKKNSDSLSLAKLFWYDTESGKTDTIMKRFYDAKNFGLDEEGKQVVFVAERDSAAKSLKKYYKLWYFRPGMDSAQMKADKSSPGLVKGLIVSPDYANNFSKDGTKLYFGMAPDRRAKDTALVDFETARLDIWNYNDDDLQPQQLVNAANELKRSYLAVINDGSRITALGSPDLENVSMADKGNGRFVLGQTTKGYRIQNQWEWSFFNDLYLVNVSTGEKKLIAKKVRGAQISPKGKYVYWYDGSAKHYIVYDVSSGKTVNASKGITVPLYDEEDDHPDMPPPHGIMGWMENDASLLVYDKYDIWKLDPTGATKPLNFTNGIGRKKNLTFRNVDLDKENNFITKESNLLLKVFDNKEKGNGFVVTKENQPFQIDEKIPVTNAAAIAGNIQQSWVWKAKNSNVIAYMKHTPQSMNLFSATLENAQNFSDAVQLTNTNPQQKDYNWYTVELHKWKMFDGKMSEGLLFKPENFDPNKKYPVIFYFYERDADGRYLYRSPAPSASTINIAYFTSNGYLVFDPNIYYKNGQPGESAYNSVVSAANYLSKMKFVDSTRMGIQGQSWGGYQVAYLVTRTNKFAAAGAGAPVSNMFSAYGGIRWGSGLSRQAQYEKNQSRIGFTPWQRPDLYIKNSPVFHADKVTTPLLLMHNDKDGAVPWYQSIEYFTGLRRLGKRVWLLQYNDEDHNLVERRNRKDLSVRLAQFFGHYLKNQPMPRWMKEGVPATEKGIEWGLQD